VKKALFPISLSLLMIVVFGFRANFSSNAQQTADQETPLLRAAENAWQGEKWEDAVAQYRQFIRQNPNHPVLAEAHYKIGFYLSFTASPEEAIAEYENALRLQPAAEIVHEAKEGIAALRYFQGRYEESQRLFGEIMRETEDWATFKESAQRFKEMTHLIALQKLPVKRSALDCGPRALEYACNQMGVRYASAKLKSLYETRGKGVSLQQLRDTARRAGLPAWGVKIQSGQLEKVATPFIAHLRNHYWVVTKVTDDRVDYFDPDRGATYLSTKLFLERWRGNALVFGKKRPSNLVAQMLDDSEMSAISGGHHLHGNNNGGRGSNNRTLFTNQNSCPAGPTPNSVGLPHWSVNMANYNLIVEDTDFVYGGRGLSVGLTRTYNADDGFETAFGRSWTFNYNVELIFEPNRMVTVRREDGKKDSFGAPRGDGTHNPPPWTHDQLIRNADGTYRLFLKGSRITQHFNAQGKLIRIADRNDNAVTLQYQDNRLVSVTDAVGRITRFRYNASSKIDEVTDPLGRKATFGYDAKGQLVTYVDMAGNNVSYTYDSRSYMTSMTTPGGTTQFKIGTTPQFGDRPYVLKEVIEPDGGVTRYDTGNEIAWFTNPRGVQTFVFNDSDGQTTEIEDGLGKKTSYEFDSSGLRKFTDAKGVSIGYRYNNQDNLASITDPFSVVTSFTYDAAENVKEIKSSAGRSATFDYDGKGNVIKATDPKKGVTLFTYDSFGQLMKITDPRGNDITFTYDSIGNRKTFATPGSTTTYDYDAIGRLASLTDPAGNTFRYAFDGIDRPLTLTAPDGKVTSYQYNCCKLSTITDSVGTLRFDYYPSGRLRQFTNTFNQTIGYSYDQNGNLLTLTYPDGKVVRYEYDANNRMKKVTDWLNNTTVYNYDEAGKLVSGINSNGTRTGYKYDNGNQLKTVANMLANGTSISVHRYDLDSYNSRTKVTAGMPSTSVYTPKTTIYGYDDDNRLLSAAGSNFTYDANGNLKAIRGVEQSDLVFDSFSRLQSKTSRNDHIQFQYDAMGNRISRAKNGKNMRYSVNPNTTLPQVLIESDENGRVLAYNIYGIGLVSKVTTDGQAYNYHFDGNGNVAAITDRAQKIVNRYFYTPFGDVIGESEEFTINDYKFAGLFGVISDEKDLLYMRARYYSSSFGRFISKDPAGYTDSLNSYAYVNNHPEGRVDPLGLLYLDLGGSLAIYPTLGGYGGPVFGVIVDGTGIRAYFGNQIYGSPNFGISLNISGGSVDCGVVFRPPSLTGVYGPFNGGIDIDRNPTVGIGLRVPYVNVGTIVVVSPYAVRWTDWLQSVSNLW